MKDIHNEYQMNLNLTSRYVVGKDCGLAKSHDF